MKTYIIGTGGVGGYFGGKLAKSGNDVTFVARGEFYEAMKKDGLTVKTTDGDFTINPVQVIDNIPKIENPDLIIISVKTYDTQSIAEELNRVISPNTTVITFQNGIDNDNQIKKYLKQGKVYAGVAYVISSREKAGVILQTGGLKRLVFGDRSKVNPKELKDIELLFKNAQIDTILSDDIERDLWKKFAFINSFAGFTAICRTSIGNIRSEVFTYNLYKESIKETISIANSLGINLPDTIFDDTVKLTDNTTPDSKSSLLIDIENNRLTEVESLQGTLVKLAEQQKVNIPIIKTLYSAIKTVNNQILFNLVAEYVDKSFGEKSMHFERTVYWLQKLVPQADLALQISAYAHDIQRAFAQKEALKKIESSENGFKDEEFLKNHQEEGGKLMYKFLKKHSQTDDLANRVQYLISKHEVGGDEDQNMLKDADSISYFECNADHFVTKYAPILGTEKVKSKFDWMFERITSDQAKQIAEPMYKEALNKLLSQNK